MSGSTTIVLSGGLAFALFASSVSTADPPIDRLLHPQRLVVEVFNERGTQKLQIEHVVNGQPVSLASLFAPGGIEVQVVYRTEPLRKPRQLIDREWLREVARLQTPSTSSVWYASVLVVDDNEEGILSIVPDMESRRTVIVYVKPNRVTGSPLRDAASLTDSLDPSLSMFRSAAHELTHVLNLHHRDWEGSSFTEDSTIEGYSSITSTRWHLSEASLEHLRHAPDDFVRPDGVAFGVVLPDHEARHQRTPGEQYTIFTGPEEPAPRIETRVIAPPSLGPLINILTDLSSDESTTRESVSVKVAVQVGAGGRALKDIVVTLVEPTRERELRALRTPQPQRQEISMQVTLQLGANRIRVRASDEGGHSTEQDLSIVREDISGKLLAVVFGAQNYRNVRALKHSLADADDVQKALAALGAKGDRLVYRPDPDLRTLRSTLGRTLRDKAGPRDVVIVYFAGHGSAEHDPDSGETDGLSKYLLPVDADPLDLDATALPMAEINRLLGRVQVQTMIVILDACFSGAAGGRTVAPENTRAIGALDESFLKRNAGAGRVILASAGANETAQESDDLGHGVFTYYLLEALKGKADTKSDGTVNLNELVDWLTEQVKHQTNDRQKPVFWGTVADPPVLWQRE